VRTAAGKELVPATCKSGDLALRGGRAVRCVCLCPSCTVALQKNWLGVCVHPRSGFVRSWRRQRSRCPLLLEGDCSALFFGL